MNFFDRLQRLREARPHPCIFTTRSENCDYCPYHANGRNSYMIIGHNLSEDCYYGIWVGTSRDCVDCAFLDKSELCYECVDCRECYACDFCQECMNCTDCAHCYDCKGCSNCFGCVNLRNKSYFIFNKQYSKDDYLNRIAGLREKHINNQPPQEFEELKAKSPRIALQGFNNENVAGDHIYSSKNAFYCFDVSELEDAMYIFNSYRAKDTMDCCYTAQGAELNYMCHSAVSDFNCNFCDVCWNSQNLEYCEYVFNSHDCFGCVSRNHAEYEILNEKYGKDEYFKRVAQIKDELKRENSYGRWWWPSPYGEVKPFSSYMA